MAHCRDFFRKNSLVGKIINSAYAFCAELYVVNYTDYRGCAGQTLVPGTFESGACNIAEMTLKL